MDDIERLKSELANLKLVVGTLAIWLQQDIGRKNCEDLIEQLNKVSSETETEKP